jgi:hypothetical protein
MSPAVTARIHSPESGRQQIGAGDDPAGSGRHRAVFIRGRCDGRTRPADGLTVAELRRAAWSDADDAAP